MFRTLGFHRNGLLKTMKERMKQQLSLQNLPLCETHTEKLQEKIIDYLSKTSLYDQYRLKNRTLQNKDTRNKVTKATAKRKHHRRVGLSKDKWQSFFKGYTDGPDPDDPGDEFGPGTSSIPH